MSEGDDFLSRWSRRKRAVAAEQATAPDPAAPDKPSAEAREAAAPGPAVGAPDQAAQPVPEFDVASLPPIESIVADTDIRDFLKPGVPTSLRHAALRHAWSADPVIRDFRGLAENDWDFNSSEVYGFGPLDPGLDVKKMVAQLFGEAPPAPAEEEQPASAAAEQQAVRPPYESDAPQAAVGAGEAEGDTPQPSDGKIAENIVQCGDDAAPQQEEVTRDAGQEPIRRHGGALPRVLPS